MTVHNMTEKPSLGKGIIRVISTYGVLATAKMCIPRFSTVVCAVIVGVSLWHPARFEETPPQPSTPSVSVPAVSSTPAPLPGVAGVIAPHIPEVTKEYSAPNTLVTYPEYTFSEPRVIPTSSPTSQPYTDMEETSVTSQATTRQPTSDDVAPVSSLPTPVLTTTTETLGWPADSDTDTTATPTAVTHTHISSTYSTVLEPTPHNIVGAATSTTNNP